MDKLYFQQSSQIELHIMIWLKYQMLTATELKNNLFQPSWLMLKLTLFNTTESNFNTLDEEIMSLTQFE